MHSDARLTGQVLGKKDITVPLDMRAYVFRDIVHLPADSIKHLPGMMVKRKITLAEMKSEAQNLSKLHKVQAKFMELMDLQTWQEAVERFPMKQGKL